MGFSSEQQIPSRKQGLAQTGSTKLFGGELKMSKTSLQAKQPVDAFNSPEREAGDLEEGAKQQVGVRVMPVQNYMRSTKSRERHVAQNK